MDGSGVGVVGLAGDWDPERGDGDCRGDVAISGITGGGGAGGRIAVVEAKTAEMAMENSGAMSMAAAAMLSNCRGNWHGSFRRQDRIISRWWTATGTETAENTLFIQ